MRRVILTIMAGMACLLSLDAGRVRAEDAARIITSRDRFTIPFRYDQELLSRLQAREVVLFVSVDEGRSWNEAGKQTIDRQNFLFEPTADGEYWFSVAIRDAENRLHPNPRQSPPGLKVVVDRKLPELSLQLIREDENRVRLTWKIKDPHADVDTLLLEFRNRPEDDWKMVYIAKALSGQTSWKTESDQLPEVRGQVFDTAGNVAQSQVALEPKVAEPLLVEKAPQVETVTAYESSVMNHPPLTSSDMPLIMPGKPGKSSAAPVPIIQPAPVLQAPVVQEQETAPLPVVNAPVLESLPSLPAAEVPPPAFGPTPGAPTLTTPIPDVGMSP
ncbi:MAG: hypothetical protein KDA78_07575, partial [Planctomycetaceae bacterium]|nr:hypothetical protein [Planctomycetaceae bacterium]